MTSNFTQPSGPLILDIEGETLTAEDIELIEHPATAGVILFARNLINPVQVKALCSELRAHRSDLLICVDQEGGRVQRLRNGVTRIPAMAEIGKVYRQCNEQGIDDAQNIAWLLATELLELGIDLTLAPVLDLDSDLCPAIGDRSFGLNPEQVTVLASAFIDGMKSAGMGSVGKHFPGHGKVSLDSHYDLPHDTRELDTFWDDDLLPFRHLCKPKKEPSSRSAVLSGVMPAHIVFDRVDVKPVGFSPLWLNAVLRDRIGFEGLIFSDDLNMAAAAEGGSYTQRAQAALAAGCDLILICNNRNAAIEILDSHLPSMTSKTYGQKCELIATRHFKTDIIEQQQKRDLLSGLRARYQIH